MFKLHTVHKCISINSNSETKYVLQIEYGFGLNTFFLFSSQISVKPGKDSKATPRLNKRS